MLNSAISYAWKCATNPLFWHFWRTKYNLSGVSPHRKILVIFYNCGMSSSTAVALKMILLYIVPNNETLLATNTSLPFSSSTSAALPWLLHTHPVTQLQSYTLQSIQYLPSFHLQTMQCIVKLGVCMPQNWKCSWNFN